MGGCEVMMVRCWGRGRGAVGSGWGGCGEGMGTGGLWMGLARAVEGGIWDWGGGECGRCGRCGGEDVG